MDNAAIGANPQQAHDPQQHAPLHMELLAPAGGFEQLRAAVAFGADAVYLAANRFGMRARATNFALEEIPLAVQTAHEAGAKVYVTCNILMHDRDLDALPPYFSALQEAGVDAVIVSDLGAAALALRHAPDVHLHVSTQASVCNALAARTWYELGARRIVLAREMSLADIARLRQEVPADLELETFVHGAMCMAVSGRCLISAYLTGRSGNKGHCTQPCRWHYQLEEEDPAIATGDMANHFALREDKRPEALFPIEQDDAGTYIMNAKDLNMLAHLRELEAAGVNSIKIEGRNKKAFYVASVVNAYRQVLDGADPGLFCQELQAISHRPYSTGFYFGEAPQAWDYDGYEQTTLHVADVLACEPLPQPARPANANEAPLTHRITARCRNRFAEWDALEVLAPHETPFEVTVRNLEWLGEPLESGIMPPAQAVPVANRATDTGIYQFLISRPIPKGSYLRRRQFRRSARSGQDQMRQ